MIFKIRSRASRIGLREHAELARRHRQRTAPPQRIFQSDAQLSPDAVGERVQRPGVANLEDGADLQVVLQVFAHARAFMDDLDANPGQTLGLTDAGKLQELGRVDRSRGHQDLGLGERLAPDTLVPVDHAADLAAFDDHPFGLGLDDDPQVGPLHRRAQEAVGRVPAHAPALVHLEVA